VPAFQVAMAENAAAHRAGDGKRREREQGWLVGISEPGDHVAGLVGNDRPGDERDRDRKCGGYEPREGERNALPERSDDEQAGGPHDRQPKPAQPEHLQESWERGERVGQALLEVVADLGQHGSGQEEQCVGDGPQAVDRTSGARPRRRRREQVDRLR
jgi:hypothetical protein